MRSFAALVAVGFVALVDQSVLAQPGRGEQSAVRNGWLSSLTEGKAQAKKSGKPMMVVLRCVP